jgi:hypothetical protein
VTKEEAIAIVVDIASRWGENAEEDFRVRITAEMTDEQCEAARTEWHDLEDVTEVRDLWRAIELLTKKS